MALRLLILTVGAALMWWLFVGPGSPLFTEFLLSGFRSGVAPSVEVEPPTGPTVADAQAVLAEFAPDKYAMLADRDNPEITQVAQGTTFLWEYVEAEGNAARVGTLAITLDVNGQLVGADFR